jgi:PAS domain S-box-containing protein
MEASEVEVIGHPRIDSLAVFLDIYNISADAIIILDEDHRIRFFNPSASKIFGYEPSEVLGHPIDLLIPSRYERVHRRHVQEFAKSTERIRQMGQRSSVIGRRKDGSEFPADVTIAKRQIDEELVFIAIVRDIRDRHEIEDQLRETAERAQLIMRATTDAIWDWDLATNQVQWNHGLRTLFGYSDDAIRGHSWWMAHVHPDDIESTEASVQAAIANGETFWTGEYRYLRADGSYAHVVDHGYVIHDEAGKPLRMVGSMVDITDRVLLAEAHARAVVEERQRLARNLHDSVTQLLYSSTLLAEAARRLAVAGDHQRVEHYLTRLGETTQQSLREMRLLLYELLPPVLEEQGLVGALQRRLELVEKRAGIKTDLTVSGEYHLPLPLEEELYLIAQEALNNSLKHAGSSSSNVRISSDGEHVLMEVVDHGVGFDPLEVLHRGGMGLDSMRERAQHIGAELIIHSEIGRGTTVRVKVKNPGDPVKPPKNEGVLNE